MSSAALAAMIEREAIGVRLDLIIPEPMMWPRFHQRSACTDERADGSQRSICGSPKTLS
jgi:hypothetical protein